MNCELSRSLLHGYMDGELDASRAEEFEQHLENCAHCIAHLEEQEKLRASLKVAQLYERAPESLDKRFRRQIANDEAESEWSWLSILQWVGASAAIILVAAVSYLGIERYFAAKPPVEQAQLTEAIDAHVRSLQPGHLADVLSTDQHTVKPWFDGKLDYVPPVKDLAESGFPLVGGRLDVLNGRSVAVLIYGRRKHFINVFVWPEPSTETAKEIPFPTVGSRNGYQWNFSRAHGMQFFTVSDVSATDLHDLAELLQE